MSLTTPEKKPQAPRPQLQAIERGILGATIMGFGLGFAIGVGEIVQLGSQLNTETIRLLQAFLCSLLVVPAILLLRSKIDRRPLHRLGLPGLSRSLITLGMGIGLTLGAALLVLGLATLIGWLHWGSIVWPTLISFIATSALIIFLYEALPEELALRGYTYNALNGGFPRWLAAGITTLLFLLVPGIANAAWIGLLLLAGESPPPFSLIPTGEDPATYFSFLFGFGIVLVLARIVTGSIWTAIGIHLTFLIVNRIILAEHAANTGWLVELASPLAILVIPLYLSLVAIGVSVIPGMQEEETDWNQIETDSP